MIESSASRSLLALRTGTFSGTGEPIAYAHARMRQCRKKEREKRRNHCDDQYAEKPLALDNGANLLVLFCLFSTIAPSPSLPSHFFSSVFCLWFCNEPSLPAALSADGTTVASFTPDSSRERFYPTTLPFPPRRLLVIECLVPKYLRRN